MTSSSFFKFSEDLIKKIVFFSSLLLFFSLKILKYSLTSSSIKKLLFSSNPKNCFNFLVFSIPNGAP
jgi:hypothetical protein